MKTMACKMTRWFRGYREKEELHDHVTRFWVSAIRAVVPTAATDMALWHSLELVQNVRDTAKTFRCRAMLKT